MSEGSGPSVAHFSTKTTGGAAIAARRLHDGLVQRGVDSRFYFAVGAAPAGDGSYRRIDFRGAGLRGVGRITQRLRHRYLRRRYEGAVAGAPGDVDRFGETELAWKTAVPAEALEADVLQLHWITGFLDYASFFASVPESRPIVWTLHDMNPFTAGCHYAWDCDKFTTRCEACPQLGPEAAFDLAARSFDVRRAALAGRRLHVVADSRWLEGQARRSALLSGAESFRTIHYGLDADAYAPRDRVACKRALGIAERRFVIAFGATSLHNRRKGLRVLLEALARLDDKASVTGLVFGPGVDDNDVAGLPAMKVLGPIASTDLKATVYSAADVFVIPSLEEAFGQTAMEAMACGTPVVGSRTGGIPELVRDGETGRLASPGDPADLARALGWMRTNPEERRRMGAAARAVVEAEFTRERQAADYVALYEEILAARPTAAAGDRA